MPKTVPILGRLKSRQILVTASLIGFIVLQCKIQAASSVPTGGSFAAGSGRISASGNTLTIDQNSLKGIIDWNTFSIGNGATVNFKNGTGATLNRVTGNQSSSILGRLSASGTVYLINPLGVLIAHGATIHTGGDFLATTLNLPNSTFLGGGPLILSGSSSATVINLGDLSSSGGNIYLIGHTVTNNGAIMTANGTTGLAAGSQVLITDTSTKEKVAVQAPGGDVTNTGFITAARAELKSNHGNIYALAGNNGGQIQATGTAAQDGHVWLVAANGTASVSGAISAVNVDGNGGAIETSGSQVVTNGAKLTTGKGGNWLLDPDNLTIDSTLAGTIQASLNGGTNVTEQTTASGTGGSGDISVASNIAWTTGANLTLSAYRNITVNNLVSISNTGAGNLTLYADNAASGVGTVSFSGTGNVAFTGSGNISVYYHPTTFPTFNGYTGSITKGTGTITSYMTVDNISNLQNITIAAANYALNANIDASSVSNFTPIANLGSGQIFDGQGHTVSNITVTTSGQGGFFAATSGTIKNLSLVNESISGAQISGGLAARQNGGTIDSSTTSGTVSVAGANTWSYGGGLVGFALGNITNSVSSAHVNASSNNYSGGGAPVYVLAGGVVGYGLGTISNSYASGPVTLSGMGSSNMAAGGFAGQAPGGVTNSYSTGAVTSTASGYGSQSLGGFAGQLQSNGGNTVTSSYWDTQSSGLGTSIGGTGQTTSQLQSGSFPTGFTSTNWVVAAGFYPFLTFQGKVVAGTVYNGTSPLAAVTVSGLSSGASLFTVITNSSGFYSFFVPVSAFNGGTGVLTYLTGGIHGNSFSDGGVSGSYTGMNIYAGTLQLLNRQSSNYSGMLSALGAALGGSSGANFLFSINSGNVSLNTGTNLSISSQTGFALDQAISTTGTVAIASQGAVTESSPITASTLSLSGAGSFALNQGNTIGTLSANTGGSLAFTNSSSLAIGAAGGVTGVTAGGTVSVNTTAGNLSIAAGSSVSASGSGNALQLSSANAFLNLGSSSALNIASGGGRWLVYSQNPSNDNDGSLAESFKQYNATYGVTAPAQNTGNGLLYTVSPTISTTLTGNATKTYDGTLTAALSSSNFTSPMGAIQGDTVILATPVSGTYGSANANSGIGVSAIGISVGSASNGNISVYGYQMSSPSATASIGIINPALLTYTANSTTRTYGGNNPVFTGTVSGFVNGQTQSSATTGSIAFSNAATTSSNVGAYAINGSGLNANNGNYTFGQAAGNSSALTINPALLTYAANASSQAYGASSVFTGSVTGFLNGQTQSSATTGTTAFTSSATPLSNVGTYAINGAGLTAIHGNYSFAQAAGNSSALTINPALLTYVANPSSETYGAAVPSFTGTVTGFVNGQTQGLATTGTVAFMSSVTPLSNVGTYAINGAGLTAIHGNYSFAQAAGNSSALTINPALLTYVANPSSQTYGAAVPSFTGTVTGFVNGQTHGLATTGTVAFTSPATPLSNVGTYAINGAGLTAIHGNYSFAQAAGNSSAFTINPATLTYSADAITRPTGTTNSPFTGSITGFVNNETLVSATTGAASFASTADSSSPAGSYAINGSGLAANHGNYIFTQDALNASALTVTAVAPPLPTSIPPPAPSAVSTATALTIVVNNSIRLQDQANPVFTATYDGPAISGLDLTSILAGLSFQTAASTSSAAGTYEVTASGAGMSGYVINVVPGTLTIVGSSPVTLPSQGIVSNPQIPDLLIKPEAIVARSVLQPANAIGSFDINVSNINNSFGLGFPQTPLAESSFFSDSANEVTHRTAGAKP